MNNLKADIVNGAFSRLRISGLTVQASPEDNELALRRLESLAGELSARNICPGYNFEDQPDLGSTSGLAQQYWDSFENLLALRLMPDFGKGLAPDPILINNANSSSSFLYATTANPRETQYPRRQPIGSGNEVRRNRFRKFYRPAPEPPNECKTHVMYLGDVNSFTEHFDAYLLDGEDIASYTISSDTGLTITNDTKTFTDVTYTVTATGNNGNNNFLRVKIVVTTTNNRIETRYINFTIITE